MTRVSGLSVTPHMPSIDIIAGHAMARTSMDGPQHHHAKGVQGTEETWTVKTLIEILEKTFIWVAIEFTSAHLPFGDGDHAMSSGAGDVSEARDRGYQDKTTKRQLLCMQKSLEMFNVICREVLVGRCIVQFLRASSRKECLM